MMPPSGVVFADGPGIRRAADAIRSGGVIAYPTETVYGLGADPYDSQAVERVFEIKERERHKPVILLVRGEGDVRSLVTEVPTAAVDLMRGFWPGPLTLVFLAEPGLPARLLAGGQTIALRVSPNAVVKELLEAVGGPITSTSANRSGEPPARSGMEAADRVGDLVDLVLDGGTSVDDRPSTVVDVSEAEVKVLREGRIAEDAIREALG